MTNIVCKICGKGLNRRTENGEIISGYYLFNNETYCPECWKAVQIVNQTPQSTVRQ